MKVVLSNKIFLEYDEKLYEKCKSELTYRVPSKIFGEPPETITTLSRIGHRAICIPIGRTDLIPIGAEIIDKRTLNPVYFPEFKHTLRPSQIEVYDDLTDNCMINANTSWGKTFTAIAVAAKLGQKTLIITHTAFLRDQWIEEVEYTLGIKAGQIGGGIIDIKSPIVVANIQTLRKHAKALREEFGTVFVDEVHHTPAKVFQETLTTLCARYKIGLSATLERKDFLHIVLPDYFGKKVYVPPEENQMIPEVLLVRTGIKFNSNMMIPWATRVNELMDNELYKTIVLDLAEAHRKKGHKVLIVADRTEFLDSCHMRHLENSILVIGTTKQEDRVSRHELMRTSNEVGELYGAISIYKEGISFNPLSALILATPINNDPMLKQLIGRITRIYPNKLQPCIIDLVLDGTTARKQAKARASYYMMRGLNITTVDLFKNSS